MVQDCQKGKRFAVVQFVEAKAVAEDAKLEVARLVGEAVGMQCLAVGETVGTSDDFVAETVAYLRV